MTQPSPAAVRPDAAREPRAALRERFAQVRALSQHLCAPLEPEDMVVQSMPDASPAKWHLAHTSWFFENFILQPHAPGYRCFDPQFGYLFNSYYETVGSFHPRPERGLLSRPTVTQVLDYRAHVTHALDALAADCDAATWQRIAPLVDLGCHHEQQHQELLLMDIKHLFSRNPLKPAYHAHHPPPGTAAPLGYHGFPEGLQRIGHDGAGFAFDNESPRHRVFVAGFELADRLVTEGEYLEFMRDGGYRTPQLWLSDGWATVQAEGWQAPAYWQQEDGAWQVFTLGGLRPLEPAAPVCHLSLYEADAYARWAGARLPTEAEWEVAAATQPVAGHFLDAGWFHPAAAPDGAGLRQLYGDVWEWTGSPYSPYPGYRPPAGAIGEYNGKFMSNQMVLRGGACVTPPDHVRATYRNFFPPHTRWHFSGLRLARDL